MSEYEYCECAKQYLLDRLATCRLDDESLASATGYTNIDKFRRHQDAWHAFERPIPRKYLVAIGVDLNILRGALERDQVNFELMDAMPRTTICYHIRFMSTVHGWRYFDEPVPEEEAIRRVKAFSTETGLRCCIRYPQLMTIYIEPDGKATKVFYRPAMKITNNLVAIKRDSSRMETSKVA